MIIALSGWKQSGKDTMADFLVENGGFKRYAFADILKDMVSKTYDIPRSYCDDLKYKESPLLNYPVMSTDKFSNNIHKMMFDSFRGPDKQRPSTEAGTNVLGQLLGLTETNDPFPLYWTPRALCILEGSIKRSVTGNFWTQSIISKIKTDREILKEENFVITDLRYRNEAKQLVEAFDRDLAIVRIERFESVDTNDPSERDMDSYPYDVKVENKGTKEEYLKTLKDALDVLNVRVF